MKPAFYPREIGRSISTGMSLVPRLACPTMRKHCWTGQQWHPSQILPPAALFELLDQLAQGLFVVLVGHQRRVGRVHDQAIGQAQGDDQVLVAAANDRALRSSVLGACRGSCSPGRRCRAAGPGPASFRRRPTQTGPRSPAPRWPVPSPRSRSTPREWPRTRGPARPDSRACRRPAAIFSSRACISGSCRARRVENRPGPPHEDAGVPVEVAGGEKLLRPARPWAFRGTAQPRTSARPCSRRSTHGRAAFDVAERLGRIGRLDAEGHDPLRPLVDQRTACRTAP